MRPNISHSCDKCESESSDSRCRWVGYVLSTSIFSFKLVVFSSNDLILTFVSFSVCNIKDFACYEFINFIEVLENGQVSTPQQSMMQILYHFTTNPLPFQTWSYSFTTNPGPISCVCLSSILDHQSLICNSPMISRDILAMKFCQHHLLI